MEYIKYHKQIRSFTLVEMIICVAIIFIILGIALIEFDALENIIEKYNLKTQCREIHQEFLVNKNQGIMDGTTKKICIFKDKIYILTIKDPVITKKIILRDNIKITSNTYNGEYLYLYPMGTVNKAGHITFEAKGGDKMTIVIQLGTGRIYLKEGAYEY